MVCTPLRYCCTYLVAERASIYQQVQRFRNHGTNGGRERRLSSAHLDEDARVVQHAELLVEESNDVGVLNAMLLGWRATGVATQHQLSSNESHQSIATVVDVREDTQELGSEAPSRCCARSSYESHDRIELLARESTLLLRSRAGRIDDGAGIIDVHLASECISNVDASRVVWLLFQLTLELELVALDEMALETPTKHRAAREHH